MPDQGTWTPPIKNWKNIEKDSASAMLALAERYLSETVLTGATHYKRTETLGTITASIMAASIGYIVAKGTGSDLAWLCICAVVGLMFAFVPIYKNIFTDFEPVVPGASPMHILDTEATRFDEAITGTQQYVYLVMRQLEVYEAGIRVNTDINNRMKENLTGAVLAFVVVAAIIALLAVILHLN